MTSQPNPQEKKCSCSMKKTSGSNLFGEHHANYCQLCPLYTPPAQEEKKHEEIHYACKDRISVGNKNIFGKEKLFVGCCICTKHNCQPPKPKEHLAQEEKIYFAPTPTAATESFLFDLFLKYEPKEPETWEERFDEYSTGKGWEADKNMFLVLATVFEIKTFIRKELTAARTESETRGWNAAIEAALKSFQVEDYTTLCIKKILNSLKKPL